MVICLERGADLHTAQLMPLPLTVSCFSKIQIGLSFPVTAHLGSPGQRAVKRVCVCVCVCVTALSLLLVKLNNQHVRVQLPTYADNVALPAFARSMLRCCAPCHNRSTSPAPGANLLLWPTLRQTDGLTELWFCVPLDTKWVISETFLQANLTVGCRKN